MDFSKAMLEESKWTKTENGADCKNTTDSALLDLFSTIGAMRTRGEEEIIQKFDLAFQEDPLGAMRCLFYARDIRSGLGERRVFRILLKHVADKYTEQLRGNLYFIPDFGRWDDVYSLIGTKLEKDVWEFVNCQLAVDIIKMKRNEPVSLLAKWLKKADSSNIETKRLGIYTAKHIALSVYDYKRICNELRRYIKVVEQAMSERRWSDIEYSLVPSKAMMNYRNAFQRHDSERFGEYINRVNSGEEKINATTLYPYDIIEKILYHRKENKILEAQWNNLPNYVEDTNAIVMADVSGSMYGRPLATSIGLALYFAERNIGAYHNLFMTFSANPQFVQVQGNTITEKVRNINKADWNMNTNLYNALIKILEVAVENQCSQEEMPKSLIIISDMEIDACTSVKGREQLYDMVSRKFEVAGYKIPNVVFWNVNSRKDTFLADKNAKGVQLVSGQSVSTFKNLIGAIDKTPMELMYSVLNNARYQCIQLNEQDKGRE